MTDFRALCAELLSVFNNYDDESNLAGIFDDMKANKNDLLDRARAALAAEADGPAVPEGREPASVVGEPSDEEIMGLMPQQMQDDLAAAVRAMAEQEGIDSTPAKGVMRIMLNRHCVDLARAVLARFGHQPAPPAEGEVAELERRFQVWWCNEGSGMPPVADEDQEAHVHRISQIAWHNGAYVARYSRPTPATVGEVGELVAWLRETGRLLSRRSDIQCRVKLCLFDRAADLLEQRHRAPVPVSERLPEASDVYFEFTISDADHCPQAGGIAPTYAQALSEGQHYLAQYQQDGPHTLELRRVEILPPDALPLPQGEVE